MLRSIMLREKLHARFGRAVCARLQVCPCANKHKSARQEAKDAELAAKQAKQAAEKEATDKKKEATRVIGKVAPFMAELDAVKPGKLPEHVQGGYTTCRDRMQSCLKWATECLKKEGNVEAACPMTWPELQESMKQLGILRKLVK